MLEIGVIGYVLAAIGFSILSVLLITSWQGRTQGILLVLAVASTAFWAATAAYQTHLNIILSTPLVILELLHNGFWIGFLYFILKQRDVNRQLHGVFVIFLILLLIIVAFQIIQSTFSNTQLAENLFSNSFEFTVIGHLLIAVYGLVFTEQLIRNSSRGEIWTFKYLCIGVGGIFAYDFYMYADSLLYKKIDEVIWLARGYVNALVVPLIAVAAARNPQWSLDVFVSRKLVLHSTALLAGGIFLLLIAVGGYYIREFGGSWGGVAQLIFLFSMIVIFALVYYSGQVRGRVRIFVNKHFFNYRYDYRDEWLKFIDTLSGEKLDVHLRIRVISAIAEIVDSPGGLLWINRDGQFQLNANWNLKLGDDEFKYDKDLEYLVTYLTKEQQVVDLREDFIEQSNKRKAFPSWLDDLPEAWLLVPMLQQGELYGFTLLVQARSEMKINWENRDLLLTTARQATNHLALLDANEQLMEARQFETFNRLSAYIVHDLKNVVAQLSLVVKNAERHKKNPDFVDDAFKTVDNAVSKMNRMLGQLRKKREIAPSLTKVNLLQVVHSAIKHRSAAKPIPQYLGEENFAYILADADRLTSVMEHLIQNAQEATADTGRISVSMHHEGEIFVVEIQDTGAGMDAEFIKSRFFKPFDTTKGNAGMGIGVYESREIIRSFGGSMQVSSALGEGTRILIKLPISDEQVDASREST